MRALITDYGAVGDGAALNTTAIQAAVDACEASGGGTVVVPRGVFVSGSVELKSKVTLYLEHGYRRLLGVASSQGLRSGLVRRVGHV